VLSLRSASSATAALNWSEKFRRFVIFVSIRSGWIPFIALSEFAGPHQFYPVWICIWLRYCWCLGAKAQNGWAVLC